jgi:hypothetical protein
MSLAAGSLRTRLVLALVGLGLLAAAAVIAIWVATEPGAGQAAGGGRDATAGVDPAAGLASTARGSPGFPPTPLVLPGPAATPAPEWRQANPTVPSPVPNEAAPVAAPAPKELPSDPARREEAILELRRKRFAEQMDRLNRRGAARGAVPADAGARPPPQQPRPGDRRAGLAGEP